MPGTDLNLSLPADGDTMSTIVAKLTTAISAIEDDLADKVTTGELNINAELSMNGQPLVNVGGVQLAGGASAEIGTLYMDGSDLWVATAGGAVKLTAAGAVNIAGAGGIGGDYGSGDELVSYHTASQEYRFFAEPTSQWADLVADDVVLMESFLGGSVRLGVDPTITTSRSVIFKDLPASGISALVYNAATSTVEDAANARITNDVKVTTLNASSTITGTDLKHTATRTRRLVVKEGINGTGTISIEPTTDGAVVWTVIGNGEFYMFGHLASGDRPTSVSLRLNKVTGGTISITLARVTHDGGYAAIQSYSTVTTGIQTLVCTITSPVVLGANEDLMIAVTVPGVGNKIMGCSVTYNRP